MALRGIRGAITVEKNDSESIADAVRELLNEIVSANNFQKEDIASIFFTATGDIDAEYPAVAARGLGFGNVPLFCAQEMNVSKSLSFCIRILIHLNTEKAQSEMKHKYLRGAKVLRPDIV